MKQVLFLGHSVLYYFPTYQFQNWEVINLSKSGGIAKDGYKKIKNAYLDFNTLDAVLVMYGINELHYRFTPQILLENLKNILEYLETTPFKGKVILSLIMKGWENKRYTNETIDCINKDIKKIAADFEVDLFSWATLYNESSEVDPKFSTDGIHLTIDGYEKFQLQLVKLLE